MSVWRKRNEGDPTQPEKDQRCFVCGGPIHDLAIMWIGTSRIWLHATCALNLVIALSRDLSEIKSKDGVLPYMTASSEAFEDCE